MTDISRAALRRSELKSRSALLYEQYNPSHLMQREDAEIQHRGGNLRRRYGLLVSITLLSLE